MFGGKKRINDVNVQHYKWGREEVYDKRRREKQHVKSYSETQAALDDKETQFYAQRQFAASLLAY